MTTQRILMPFLNRNVKTFRSSIFYFDEHTYLKTINDDDYAAFHRKKESPFYERIHLGGVKRVGQYIPLRAMDSGIKLLLNRSIRLGLLDDVDAQYKVIKNYFLALKKWLPDSWSEPRK